MEGSVLSYGPRAQNSGENQWPVSMEACHSSRDLRRPEPASTRVSCPWANVHTQLCSPRPHDKMLYRLYLEWVVGTGLHGTCLSRHSWFSSMKWGHMHLYTSPPFRHGLCFIEMSLHRTALAQQAHLDLASLEESGHCLLRSSR